VPAGSLALVPPLVVHGFRNGSDADVRYLNLHAPGRGFADYMRALRDGRPAAYDQWDPPPDGGRPPTDVIVTRDGPVLADTAEIAVVRLSCAPGAAPGPAALPGHVVSFYVLAGELTLSGGERDIQAPAGSWAQVPAGVAHAISAAGAEPVHLLSIWTPAR